MDNWGRRIWIGVSVIAFSFVIFFVVAYFLGGWMDRKSKAILADRQVIAARSYALDNLSALKTQAPEAEAYKKKIDDLIPPQDSLLSYPEFLEGMARTDQVDVNFSFQGSPTPSTAAAPGFIGVSITVRGSLDRIRAFVSHLETDATKFLTATDSVEIVVEGDAYRADVRGRTFFK